MSMAPKNSNSFMEKECGSDELGRDSISWKRHDHLGMTLDHTQKTHVGVDMACCQEAACE